MTRSKGTGFSRALRSPVMTNPSNLEIIAVMSEPSIISALAELLVETVANGGSVSFMHPIARETATAFWESSLASADRGERVVLGASENGAQIGTVNLLLDCPPNQPHRSEIAKMMTRLSHRGRGVARALMVVAEQFAIARGRTLLTLDPAAEEGAAGLYEKMGFQRAGLRLETARWVDRHHS